MGLTKRSLWSLLILILMVVGHPLTVKAMTLTISPSNQSVALGSNVQIDVSFINPGGKLLAEYDLFLTYDPTILAYNNASFSSALGNPNDPNNWFSTTSSSPGSLEILAFPLLFDQTLQNGTSDLPLFSLNFSTLTAGTSILSFTPDSIMGDELGDPLQVDLVSGRIDVTQSTNPVPEPSTVLLLSASLLIGIIYIKRKNTV